MDNLDYIAVDFDDTCDIDLEFNQIVDIVRDVLPHIQSEKEYSKHHISIQFKGLTNNYDGKETIFNTIDIRSNEEYSSDILIAFEFNSKHSIFPVGYYIYVLKHDHFSALHRYSEDVAKLILKIIHSMNNESQYTLEDMLPYENVNESRQDYLIDFDNESDNYNLDLYDQLCSLIADNIRYTQMWSNNASEYRKDTHFRIKDNSGYYNEYGDACRINDITVVYFKNNRNYVEDVFIDLKIIGDFDDVYRYSVKHDTWVRFLSCYWNWDKPDSNYKETNMRLDGFVSDYKLCKLMSLISKSVNNESKYVPETLKRRNIDESIS